jgi:diguanylate cyclase (GGDEF)-like protein
MFLVLAGGAGFVAALIYYAAVTQDREAVRTGEAMARAVLTAQERQLGRVARDYAHWDDAVRNLAIEPDKAWADLNIGEDLTRNFGITGVLVIDGENKVISQRQSGQAIPPQSIRRWSTGVEALLSAARDGAGPPPVPATGILRAGDGLEMLSVAALVPNSDASLNRPSPALLVLAQELDEAALGALGETYLLPGLRLVPVGERIPAGLPQLALTAPDGSALGHLTWTLEPPGWRLIRTIAPVAALTLVGMLALFWIFLRRVGVELADLRTARHRLALEAQIDPLTSLPNRQLLLQEFHRILARSRRYGHTGAVFCGDIDKFGAVNDRYGHAIGDRLLVEVARRVTTAVREVDFVARSGPDSFVVVVEELSHAEDADKIAAKLIDAVAGPAVLDQDTLHPTMSLGFALVTPSSRDAAVLLSDAAEAMEQVRKAGGNAARQARRHGGMMASLDLGQRPQQRDF